MSPLTLAIAGIVALAVLIPTGRLARKGWTRDYLATYFVFVWLLGLLVALVEGRAGFLVPVLMVVYLAPFVTWREGLDRLLGRARPRSPAEQPPPKDVTPPDPRDAADR